MMMNWVIGILAAVVIAMGGVSYGLHEKAVQAQDAAKVANQQRADAEHDKAQAEADAQAASDAAARASLDAKTQIQELTVERTEAVNRADSLARLNAEIQHAPLTYSCASSVAVSTALDGLRQLQSDAAGASDFGSETGSAAGGRDAAGLPAGPASATQRK